MDVSLIKPLASQLNVKFHNTQSCDSILQDILIQICDIIMSFGEASALEILIYLTKKKALDIYFDPANDFILLNISKNISI